ncbi:hypothetical protein BACCAP_01647 [Pseudoflavonifractor capillosus ATCC 29799]|uniref:Uncharacterized protein n=1 Tax=Pseudoflavonifractor capillosus ATCC 29799 TaxID=411467 RepID=A6NTW7_9FIRM|nr:hypothetical protein BACCAP_01647 [Pseudoflavonifractor capillosus ATCC 29799]
MLFYMLARRSADFNSPAQENFTQMELSLPSYYIFNFCLFFNLLSPYFL